MFKNLNTISNYYWCALMYQRGLKLSIFLQNWLFILRRRLHWRVYDMIARMTKSILRLVIVGSFFCCVAPASSRGSLSRCLPPDIDLDRTVVVEQPKVSKEGSETRMTVRTRLARLRARCKNGKLLSSTGSEIRFVALLGCWGNPPENYQEMLTDQAREIARLRKKYIVIQIPCGGNADPRLIN